MDPSNPVASKIVWVLLNLAQFVVGLPGKPRSTNHGDTDTLTTIFATLALVLIFGVLGCIFTFYCCGNWCRGAWCCCREDETEDPDRKRPNQERTMLIPKDFMGNKLKDGLEETVDELPRDILDQIIPNLEPDENETNPPELPPPPPPPRSPAPKQLIRAPAFDIETEPAAPLPKTKHHPESEESD